MFGKQWTNTEDDFMRKHYPSESNPAICEKLGRSLRSVYSRAKILGLKKSPEFMQEQWQMLAVNLQNNGRRIVFPKEIFRRIRERKCRQMFMRKPEKQCSGKEISRPTINRSDMNE